MIYTAANRARPGEWDSPKSVVLMLIWGSPKSIAGVHSSGVPRLHSDRSNLRKAVFTHLLFYVLPALHL